MSGVALDHDSAQLANWLDWQTSVLDLDFGSEGPDIAILLRRLACAAWAFPFPPRFTSAMSGSRKDLDVRFWLPLDLQAGAEMVRHQRRAHLDELAPRQRTAAGSLAAC